MFSQVPSQGLAGAWAQRGGGRTRPNTHSSQEAWPVAGCASGQGGTLSTQLQPAGRAPVCPMSTLHTPVNPPRLTLILQPPSPLPSPPHPTPPRPPRPPPPHTASSQVHQLNAEVAWTLRLLPGPGKLKALPSSQVMGEAEACLPGEPTLVPAGQTGWRQGPAGDRGTDPRGWVG